MVKKIFKTICQHRYCSEEIVIAIGDDGFNVDQLAANVLCRRLEKHFKDKHPQEKINEGKIIIRQGDKVATLQEDGDISEKELMSPKTWRNCEECDKNLVVFEDDSCETHNCSQNIFPHNPINNNPNQPSNSNPINLTPLYIIGTIVIIAGGLIAYYLFKKSKKIIKQ